MKTIPGLSDTAVALRFDGLFQIPQWTAGKARQVVSEFHATTRFQQFLQHEIANGFIPSGFSLQQAQNVYLGIVNEVEKILKAQRPPQRPPNRQLRSCAAESSSQPACRAVSPNIITATAAAMAGSRPPP